MPLRDRHGKSAEDYQESLISALDAISARPYANRSHPVRWIWVLIPVAALWLNWNHVAGYLKQVPTPVTRASSLALPAVSSDAPVVRVPESHDAQAQAQAQPRSLSDCMAGGTVIDEQVLHCRFGSTPHAQPERSHGMVSAAYMAKYQAEQNAHSETGSGRRLAGPEEHWIRGWDGNGSYLATWQVASNEVDSASVCVNYRRGSIEYRECRKAAKQWFKDQCRSAGDSSDVARQRYCSAASSFSPMG